jgi:hypothetical protein
LAFNQLIQDRVYAAINNTMQTKGFQQVTDNPQLTVYTHAVTEQKTKVYTDPGTLGYGYGRGVNANPCPLGMDIEFFFR